jgi:hypothetical protein
LKDALRGIKLALRNMMWQTVYSVSILLLSLFPIVGWITPLISLFVECYYYGFSMLDYSCERHKLSPSASIEYIGKRKGLAIGNGLVFYLMHCIPIIGWIFAPAYAVIAATISFISFTGACICRTNSKMNSPVVYLIPTVLQEDAIETIPAYVFDAVRDCQSFFVENERTARRFLKKIWKEMVIDAYEWHAIPKQGEDEDGMLMAFTKNLKEKKNIGIISEAGCPGIADPGQRLVAIAHEQNVIVKPLVGPSSILLAIMASGLMDSNFNSWVIYPSMRSPGARR